MTKTLALCADDYGLSAPVSRGILRLAAIQRLSHTSCIVNGSAWPALAGELAGSGLQAGLHLNLTEGRPLSPALAALWAQMPSLPSLIVQANAHRLPVGQPQDAAAHRRRQTVVVGAQRQGLHGDGSSSIRPRPACSPIR